MENTAYIIKRPIISEKSLLDARSGVFTFIVDKNATKGQIGKSIEELFKVHVTSVATNNVKGKKRMTGKRRIPKYLSAIKKARVKLTAGEKIDLFEIGEQK